MTRPTTRQARKTFHHFVEPEAFVPERELLVEKINTAFWVCIATALALGVLVGGYPNSEMWVWKVLDLFFGLAFVALFVNSILSIRSYRRRIKEICS